MSNIDDSQMIDDLIILENKITELTEKNKNLRKLVEIQKKKLYEKNGEWTPISERHPAIKKIELSHIFIEELKNLQIKEFDILNQLEKYISENLNNE